MSDEDLLWLYPDRTLAQAVTDCRSDCSAVLFILTLGPEGSLSYIRDIKVKVAASKVENIVDTVGAGDTFMATLLSWVIDTGWTSRDKLAEVNEDNLRRAITAASAAAAINCQRSGCNPPTKDEFSL